MVNRPNRRAAQITLAAVSVSNPPAVPTGSLYLAAVLEREGYAVDFRNYAAGSYWQLSPSGLAEWLGATADIVGLSCLGDTLPFVVAAVEEFKVRYPHKIVILGGPGPTGVARELVEAFPAIDFVVVGEGEETILELVGCLTDGKAPGNSPTMTEPSGAETRRRGGDSDQWMASRSTLKRIHGIVYRDGDVVEVNPQRERIRDLDTLPVPLYEAIDIENYPMVNIVSSRGCPYQCTFCDVAPMWSRKNVHRSVESVIDEIKLLRTRYGRQYFEFTDETFVLKEDRVFEFCDRLKRHDLGVRWSASGRVNLVNRKLLAEMASAGCEALFFGIESGSDRVLERVKKDFTIGEAVDALHTTLEYMRPVASFIWGFPFETEEDITKTLLVAVYLSQIGVDSRLNRLTPFPLMPLYREYGARLDWFDDEVPYSGTEPFRAIGYPAAVTDLIKSFPRIFPSFYCLPTENLEGKSGLVRSLGRYWQVSQWPTAGQESAKCASVRANDGRRPPP
jgi:radical SAM superfamily enzyme YgiQ (UPF0313 family)